eukprot:2325386-Rhodomonas_salina.1
MNNDKTPNICAAHPHPSTVRTLGSPLLRQAGEMHTPAAVDKHSDQADHFSCLLRGRDDEVWSQELTVEWMFLSLIHISEPTRPRLI